MGTLFSSKSVPIVCARRMEGDAEESFPCRFFAYAGVLNYSLSTRSMHITAARMSWRRGWSGGTASVIWST